MGAIDEYGELRDPHIGISREMDKIIKARQPIIGFLLKYDADRYYIKHNSYYYTAHWFNYEVNTDIYILKEFT